MVATNTVSANMADEGLHPPAYPWYHKSPLHTFDHAAYVFLCERPDMRIRSTQLTNEPHVEFVAVTRCTEKCARHAIHLIVSHGET